MARLQGRLGPVKLVLVQERLAQERMAQERLAQERLVLVRLVPGRLVPGRLALASPVRARKSLALGRRALARRALGRRALGRRVLAKRVLARLVLEGNLVLGSPVQVLARQVLVKLAQVRLVLARLVPARLVLVRLVREENLALGSREPARLVLARQARVRGRDLARDAQEAAHLHPASRVQEAAAALLVVKVVRVARVLKASPLRCGILDFAAIFYSQFYFTHVSVLYLNVLQFSHAAMNLAWEASHSNAVPHKVHDVVLENILTCLAYKHQNTKKIEGTQIHIIRTSPQDIIVN